MTLDAQIEAFLFYKTEPVSFDALSAFFSQPREEIDRALNTLNGRLLNGGTRIVRTDTTVQLVTAPESNSLIEQIRKEELRGDIGRAGAETLSIILYRGPISRADVDRIRGVNSTFIIRNLLVRGLIERREREGDARSFVYAATPQLFAELGITRREELPDFGDVLNTLDQFEREENEQGSESTSNL